MTDTTKNATGCMIAPPRTEDGGAGASGCEVSMVTGAPSVGSSGEE